MRVILLMYPGPGPEAGVMPPQADINATMDFNQRMVDAGVLIDAEGTFPSAQGARVRFGKGKPIVTDGPFTETKEVFGGYWMLNVGSLADAVEWARQAPCAEGAMIEVRRIISSEDFSEESREREAKMHETKGKKGG